VHKRALSLAGAGEDPSGIVAHSEAMRRVLELARKARQWNAPVLVTGESGVGRSASAAHPRLLGARPGVFVAINCGAYRDTARERAVRTHGAPLPGDAGSPGLFEAASAHSVSSTRWASCRTRCR